MSQYFDQKAADWDADERRKQLSSAIGSSILANVSLHDRMEVLDFGAGTGLISAHVAPRVRKIVAVDTSQAMLATLAAKPELRGKVEPVCVDITETPLGARFDLLISAMAMHHVPDTAVLIQTFADHLKPAGRLALADLDTEDGSFHPDETAGVFHHGFDRGELQAMLEMRGFVDIHFFTAHTVMKDEKRYPVFLVTATKKRVA
ncbi:MAG: class I SAM-dependent methyltransferase [Gammaproteobacteria bacterium]|jgi:2-polyprenyl-3-methyl-5-hydroxy-6-metoxy-1,4-benzoquinol methylase